MLRRELGNLGTSKHINLPPSFPPSPETCFIEQHSQGAISTVFTFVQGTIIHLVVIVMEGIWEDTLRSPADTAIFHTGLEYPRVLVSVVEPGTNPPMDTKDMTVTRSDNVKHVLSLCTSRESAP